MSKNVKSTLFVGYKEGYLSGGQAINPEDRWSSHEDEYRYFDLEGVWLDREEAPWLIESVDVNFKPKKGQFVYVLVVIYSSGGTFGKSYGNGCIVGIYEKPEEAAKIEETIYNGTYSDNNYAPWVGYFETLENVKIECERIK